MSTTDERVALCALNKIFGYYPLMGRRLMEERGGALALFTGEKPRIPEHPELADALNGDTLEWAVKELEQVQRQGFRFLTLLDEDYPEALASCEDPPLGLYLNGTSAPTALFGLRPMIAVVGTRDLSPYGKLWCQKLVSTLAQAPVQPTIVSGLALGADGEAHRTALECGMPTLGVMATGIDRIYPFQHEPLAVSIVKMPGSGLITDYPLGTAPVALNFLRRNRIIAGLVSAVLVIESRTKGGSLMTAKYACGYAREVYALPGRLDDVRSAGCNSLIAKQMAQIIASPEQLIEDLGLGRVAGRSAHPAGNRGPGAGGSPTAAGSHAAGGSRPIDSSFAGDKDGRQVDQQDTDAEEALRLLLEKHFGAGAPPVAIGLAIRDHCGIMPDSLAALLGLPIPTILEGIGLLEAAGIVTTDLLRRCSLTPTHV